MQTVDGLTCRMTRADALAAGRGPRQDDCWRRALRCATAAFFLDDGTARLYYSHIPSWPVPVSQVHGAVGSR